MPLPPLLQRLWRRPSDEGGPKADAAAGKSPAEAFDHARTLARRRLIGAAVLLLVAVVVFPLVFETQPRPLPLDTPIQLAKGSSPAATGTVLRPVTPRVPAPGAAASDPQPAPAEPVSADVAVSAAAPGPAPAPAPPAAPAAQTQTQTQTQTVSPAPPAKPTQAAEPVPATKPPPVLAPRAAAPQASAAASDPAGDGARFVVQVGAFADAIQVRDLRARLDKLGLRKHYVQAVEVKGGTRMNRVRLGPYATRDEAARAAAQAKEAGLPAQVLEL